MAKSYRRRFDFNEPEVNEENTISDPASETQVAAEQEAVESKPVKVKAEKVVKKSVKKESFKGRVKTLSNLRKTPEINPSNILGVVKAADEITIHDESGEFYHVTANGLNGYIKKDLCEKI